MNRSFWLGWVIAFTLSMVLFGTFSLIDFSGANAPAWVQAIGSILTIGAAAILPPLHEKGRERRKISNSLKKLQEDLAYTCKQIIITSKTHRNQAMIPLAEITFFHTDEISVFIEIDFELFLELRYFIHRLSGINMIINLQNQKPILEREENQLIFMLERDLIQISDGINSRIQKNLMDIIAPA